MTLKKKQVKQGFFRKAIGRLIPFAVGCIIGGFLGAFLASSIGDNDALLLPFLLSLAVGLFIVVYLHIIVHEAGHLIAGLATGYHFSSFRIGCVMLLKQDGKLVWKRFSLAGTGGQCLMEPPELVDGKIPYVLYNLGGCLMNLLVSILFFFLWLCLPRSSIWSTICMMVAVYGVILALLNGIPMRIGNMDNDGRNVISLGKSKDALRAFWIQMKINQKISLGMRVKDMPEAWFLLPPDSDMQNSMVATIAVFACNRLIDQQNFQEAERKIKQLLAMDTGIVGLHRNLLVGDQCYLELIGENRPEVLETMYTKELKAFMKSMKTFPSVLRTEYAYALLFEKDTVKAEKIKAQFEKIAKKYPYPGDVQSERELMEEAQRHT